MPKLNKKLLKLINVSDDKEHGFASYIKWPKISHPIDVLQLWSVKIHHEHEFNVNIQKIIIITLYLAFNNDKFIIYHLLFWLIFVFNSLADDKWRREGISTRWITRIKWMKCTLRVKRVPTSELRSRLATRGLYHLLGNRICRLPPASLILSAYVQRHETNTENPIVHSS